MTNGVTNALASFSRRTSSQAENPSVTKGVTNPLDVHPMRPRPMRCAVPDASFRAPSTRRLPYWDIV